VSAIKQATTGINSDLESSARHKAACAIAIRCEMIDSLVCLTPLPLPPPSTSRRCRFERLEFVLGGTAGDVADAMTIDSGLMNSVVTSLIIERREGNCVAVSSLDDNNSTKKPLEL